MANHFLCMFINLYDTLKIIALVEGSKSSKDLKIIRRNRICGFQGGGKKFIDPNF